MATHDNCPLHDELVKRVGKCEDEIKNLQSQNNTLGISQVRTEERLNYLCKLVEDLTKSVDSLVKQPAKRLDYISTTIIATLISFISMAIFYVIFEHVPK